MKRFNWLALFAIFIASAVRYTIHHIIASDWLEYVKYLNDYYPHPFSSAMRTNPFHMDARSIVR